MPRPKSNLWQYFSINEDGGRTKKATCTFCGHRQACGVTRLRTHLLIKCTEISAELRAQIHQREGTFVRRGNSLLNLRNANRHQPTGAHPGSTAEYPVDLDQTLTTLAAHGSSHLSQSSPGQNMLRSSGPNASNFRLDNVASYPPPPPPPLLPATTGSGTATTSGPGQQTQHSQTMLDGLLARALYACNVPFSVVENPFMIDFLKRMRPGYTVPQPTQLHRHLLREQHWDLIRLDNGPSSLPQPMADASSSSGPAAAPSSRVVDRNHTNGNSNSSPSTAL